jgi:Cu/Ag efflux protein CusF
MKMITRKRIASLMVLIFGIVFSLTLATGANAQEKKSEAKPKKESRLSGTVQMIDKNTSIITLRKDNITRSVVYNNDTKFTKRNKPGGSLEDVKEGRRLICLGNFDEKSRLVATRIDVRTETP